jgi:hypothetical protein
MALKLGTSDATLAVGATPVRRVYRAGRLDFLRVTLGGSDYIISGVMYLDQGNPQWAAVVPLLTASPWYGNATIASEMEPLLLELANVPFPGLASATQTVSSIPVGPAVRVGGAVEQFQGFDYLTQGNARLYRADTGVVANINTFAASGTPRIHLVGRPA